MLRKVIFNVFLVVFLSTMNLNPLKAAYSGIEVKLLSKPSQIVEGISASIKYSCKNITETDQNLSLMFSTGWGYSVPEKRFISLNSVLLNNNPINFYQYSQSDQYLWHYDNVNLPIGATITVQINFTPVDAIKKAENSYLWMQLVCYNPQEQETSGNVNEPVYVAKSDPTVTPTVIPTTIISTPTVQPTATVTPTSTPTITESINELEPVSYITENTDTDSQEDITDNVGEQIPVILSPTTIVALSSAGIISAAGIGFLQFKTHFVTSIFLKLLKFFRFK